MAIHAHLTAADQPVNTAPRQPTEHALEIIIEPLTSGLVVDFQLPHRVRGLHRSCWRRVCLSVTHCFYEGFGSILASAVHSWTANGQRPRYCSRRRMLVGPPY